MDKVIPYCPKHWKVRPFKAQSWVQSSAEGVVKASNEGEFTFIPEACDACQKLSSRRRRNNPISRPYEVRL